MYRPSRLGSVLGVLSGVGAGLAVSVRHDEARRLVPPVEHDDQQQVPHLVAGAQVVQLTCGDRERQSRQVRDELTAESVTVFLLKLQKELCLFKQTGGSPGK